MYLRLKIFDELTALFGVVFHIPEHAEYATAVGLLWSFRELGRQKYN